MDQQILSLRFPPVTANANLKFLTRLRPSGSWKPWMSLYREADANTGNAVFFLEGGELEEDRTFLAVSVPSLHRRRTDALLRKPQLLVQCETASVIFFAAPLGTSPSANFSFHGSVNSQGAATWPVLPGAGKNPCNRNTSSLRRKRPFRQTLACWVCLHILVQTTRTQELWLCRNTSPSSCQQRLPQNGKPGNQKLLVAPSLLVFVKRDRLSITSEGWWVANESLEVLGACVHISASLHIWAFHRH